MVIKIKKVTMDKEMYKQIISGYMRKISELQIMVEEHPNNMQLGKVVRQYFNDSKNKNENQMELF